MCVPLRWAICGTGRVCADFIQSLKLLPNKHQIVAVGGTTQERANNCIQKHNLQAEALASHSQAYSHPGADAVYIGVMNSAHLPLTIGALEQGKHVLCEKPLALNEKQVKQAIDAANCSSKLLLENSWTLFFPMYQKLKDIIRNKVIGDMQIFSAQCGFIDRETVKHDLTMGGGFLLGPGYYLPLITMDLMDWQMPTQITATGVLEKSGVDRAASISMLFPNETIAHLLYTANSQIKASAEITASNGQIKVANHIWCPTEFSMENGNNRNVDRLNLPTHDLANFNYPNSAGFTYIQEHFRQCIEQGLTQSPKFTWDMSSKLINVLDQIRLQLGVKYPQDVF